MNTSIDFSGERFVPGIKGDIELEHLHRYYFAEKLTRGRVVADIACGEGYGSAILAEMATHVTGIDLSDDAVARARQRYSNDNLNFLVANAINTPLADHSIDVVVSFETIEHHAFHHEMMKEIFRILKPDGLLIMSSPDKYECTDKTGRINPFHVKELYRQEFFDLLSEHFSEVSLFGQRVQISSVIDGTSSKNNRVLGSYRFEEENKNLVPSLVPDPMFWIALASNASLPELGVSALVDPTEVEVLRCTADRSSELEKFVQHQARDIVELQKFVEHQARDIAELQKFVQHQARDIVALNEALRANDAVRSEQNQLVENLKLK